MAGLFKKLVNYDKVGPGVSKNDRGKIGFVGFFKLFKSKFWKLMALNLIYVACLIPICILCFFPIKAVVTDTSTLTSYMNDAEFSDSYVQIVKKYIDTFRFTSQKYSDDQLNTFCDHLEKAVNVINTVNPALITDGFDAYDADAYTDEQISEISAEFDQALAAVDLKIVTDNTSEVTNYIITDNNEHRFASFTVVDGKFTFTDSLSSSNMPIMMIMLCLIPIILLGPVNAAMTRLTRDFVREEPVFLLSDMWETIKKNWWQSIVLSLLQYIGAFILINALMLYYPAMSSGWMYVIGFSVCLFTAYIFISMQFYAMLMQVTLKLNLRKVIKNSFFFTVICMLKNVITIIILAALIAVGALLFIVGMAYPIVMSLLVLYMLLIGFSSVFLLVNYIAYPSIKKFVIDPYYEENKQETAEGLAAAEAKEDANIEEEYNDDELPEYVYHNGRMVHRSVFENENLFDDEVK